MSNLLAVFTEADTDAELLDELIAHRPERVTVLLAEAHGDGLADESEPADALRARLAELLGTIERRTGATVVGVAGDRAQLDGWRFDHELTAPVPLAA